MPEPLKTQIQMFATSLGLGFRTLPRGWAGEFLRWQNKIKKAKASERRSKAAKKGGGK